MNILLIGLRGSGKSTRGRALAARLSRAFVDLDEVTPREMGCATVREAFARGEAAFREAEVRALRRVLESDGQVVALGGGTPTAPGAADLIRAERRAGRARVVYLRADAAELRRRLEREDNAQRPSLTGRGVLEEIEEVFARRDPLYRDLADGVVEGENLEDLVVRWGA
ncbi:MAG: AAA family ATPase [Phycisphaeraceae bacterium]|nr:AAA family ATPase [Phycisphaeraceae bacterium]